MSNCKHDNYYVEEVHNPHRDETRSQIRCGKCNTAVSTESVLIEVLKRLPLQCEHEWYHSCEENQVAVVRCQKCGRDRYGGMV